MLKRFFASPQSTQVLCYAASQSPLNLQLLQQFTQQLKQASPYPQTRVHGLPLQPESVPQGLQKLQAQNTALVVIAADAAPASLAPAGATVLAAVRPEYHPRGTKRDCGHAATKPCARQAWLRGFFGAIVTQCAARPHFTQHHHAKHSCGYSCLGAVVGA